MPGGHLYDVLKDYAATVVFLAVGIAAIRRLVFKPARYAKGNTADAIFLLALIGLLMAADSVFEASKAAAHVRQNQTVEFLATLSLPWVLKNALISVFVAGAPVSQSGRLFRA